MARRDKGSGSLTEVAGGRWRLRAYAGRDPVTGRYRYASRTVEAKTITAARKALVAFVAEHEGAPTGSNATVRALMDDWVRHLESVGRAPRTITEARRTIDAVIDPVLGDVPLNELTARHVDEWLRTTDRLRPASRRRYFAILSAALGQAVRWGWIDRNPADRATLPELRPAAITVPDKREISALIDAMPHEVWKMALRLAVMTGARRGELCAFRWTDVEPDRLHIRRSVFRQQGETVEKGTKGGQERVIVLIEPVREILEAWAAWCGAQAADNGVDLADDAFLLSTWPDFSRPLNPDTLSAHVRRATKELGLDHLHLHSLRHFAATEMLAAGVGVRDVAEALGHADGGRLALQVYGHPTTERQKAAAAAMASALPPGHS